jgi:hypothetical protein
MPAACGFALDVKPQAVNPIPYLIVRPQKPHAPGRKMWRAAAPFGIISPCPETTPWIAVMEYGRWVIFSSFIREGQR